jgi:hypothetical protein
VLRRQNSNGDTLTPTRLGAGKQKSGVWGAEMTQKQIISERA